MPFQKGNKINLGKPRSEETKRKISEAHKGKKLSPEHIEKLRQAKIGHIPWNKDKKGVMPPPWNKGKKMSAESRQKSSLAHMGQPAWNKGKKTGIIPPTAFKKGTPSPYKGKTRPNMRGANHPQWKGGITPLLRAIRESAQYDNWRRGVYEKHEYTCQECNQVGGDLAAHHIEAFGKLVEDNGIETLDRAIICEALWNIDNGLVLCKQCHDALHKKIGKPKRKTWLRLSPSSIEVQ